MANTLNLGNGNWGVKKDSLLGYNSENGNFKPLPFDFTRASSATVVNKAGLIETVGSGEPRIDFSNNAKGALLLEPQRSNLITYSEDFSNASWLKAASTITSNIITSPDGTLNASLFQSNVTDGYMYPPSSILSSAANGTFTYSIYAKEGNTSSFTILMTGGANYVGNFNLTTVVATTSSANTTVDISNVGNGWYRCSLIASLVPSSAYSELQIGRISSGSNLYLFGAQLEQGSYATSYIPTQGSAVTRSADACSNGGNEQVINSTEGVLYAEISALANDGVNRLISLSNGVLSDNRIELWLDSTSNRIRVRTEVNNATSIDILSTITDATAINKCGVRWDSTSISLFINGALIQTKTSTQFNANILSELKFSNHSGALPFYGKTKSVQVYTTALSNAELKALTSN